jgi:hypothetical protein
VTTGSGQWWLLPVLGVIVGLEHQRARMWLIFEPPEEKRSSASRCTVCSCADRTRAAEVYAQIIADDVITLENIGDFLLDGPRGDRTRQMLADALRPAIDNAAGPVRGCGRACRRQPRFDNIREAVALEAADRTIRPFRDPEFNRQQSQKVYALIATPHQGAPAARLRRDDACRHQGG